MTVLVVAVEVAGATIRVGDKMFRADTREYLYEVETIGRETLDGTEYVKAECRHADGVVRPHYWKPDDVTHMYR
jgi:hypothetical protein